MEMAAEKVAATEEVAAEALAARHYEYLRKSPSTRRVLPELRGSQHSAFFRNYDASLPIY